MKYHVEFDLDFKRNPHKGLYVVLEGVNASGKSTQVEHLKEYFQTLGREVVITSEPNDSLPAGRLVRDIITRKTSFPSAALQYLYTADRVVNHETIIEPALKEGKVVLSSRNFWSALVYGVMDVGGVKYTKRDADLMLVTQGILSMYHRFMLPDVTFFLDVEVDTVMSRMKLMGRDRDIYEKKDKLTQLINGYRWVANQFADEFVYVDGERELQIVTKELIAVIGDIKK
ncbi:MAG: dTMP kinase [Candidatus Levybacteria bacterium]|nr:dTMP kinase [Candidatus Levybacteria bacterium]